MVIPNSETVRFKQNNPQSNSDLGIVLFKGVLVKRIA